MASPRTNLSSNRSVRRKSEEPTSLLRPPRTQATDVTLALLNRVDLAEDVISLLRGDSLDRFPKVPENPQRKLFNERRAQIRELAAQVESGGAEMDEHNRLVPTPQQPQPPRLQHPPVHPGAAALLNNNQNADNEEEERRWLEREQYEAAEEIAKAVRRYREQGAPEDDFILVRIAPREQSTSNLSFRRICFAVLAIATAFVCIMLQTLPLMEAVTPADPIFDKLMWEVLHVREFDTHVRSCPGLHRESTRTWKDWFSSSVDCADGVLHIPAQHVISSSFRNSPTTDMTDALLPYRQHGVNVSWFLPCSVPPEATKTSSCYPGESERPETCSQMCFRGIHDGLVSETQVNDALRMGAELIEAGGDHFDIHNDVSLLSKWIPGVVATISDLLRNDYRVATYLAPVAFRVSISLPMDGNGVPLYGQKSTNLLVRNINQTNYLDWLEACARQNELASYSLPPPFATKPVRDTCNLMADLEADAGFAVHTGVFLSEAAGQDYTGGAAVYLDDHPSNRNRRLKARRGVSVDGTPGRVVVSTGGLENQRCRMPTRAGVRAMLQIWWGCPPRILTS